MEFSSAQLEQVARSLLGEPNRALSNRHELRFGTHGSVSVDLKKCLWFDHELKEGGDTFALAKREIGGTDRDVFVWLERNGFKATDDRGNGHGNAGADVSYAAAGISYDAAADPFKNFIFKKTTQPREAEFRIVKTWLYVDENGAELFEVCRLENGEIDADGKPVKIYFQRHKTAEGYVNSVKGIRQVPYRLPALIEAIAQGKTVFVAEGEKCADAVFAIGGTAATCNAMGAGKWPDELTPCFKDADVVILPDNDETGAKHAGLVAGKLHGVARRVRILELPDLPPKGDIADWIVAHWQTDGGTFERLCQLVEANSREPVVGAEAEAPADEGAASEEDCEIARLATLSKFDYERERKDAAKRLDIRAAVLDKLVAAARPADESVPGQGRQLALPEPEPWPMPVNGATLITGLMAAIRRYVMLSEQDALAAALWVLHTYCFETFACTPRLAITAPEKRCGKTTLLDVIKLLVPRPLSTANISAAATFRTIETARPILLVDEADTFLSDNEELRGILNSGHRSGGQVIRTVGDDFEARAFSTHCPVAIAQIGKLPDTLADRGVHISMKRRAPGEPLSRFRHGRTPELIEAASKAARWTADNAEAIRECDPVIPDAIFNRAADNWAPLLAIAEVIGGGVVALARQAALAACGVEEELSPRAALLADIREVFAENAGDRMSSKDLVDALVAMADKPWGECNHGKPLTQNGLARRLKGFGIFHKKLRIGGGTPNGYERAAFDDAFSRYLPNSTFQTGTMEQINRNNDLNENQSGTRAFDVPDQNQHNCRKSLDCSIVPDENPESGAHDENGANGTGQKAKLRRLEL
jgi:Protein of unknown function (DUF3631)